MNELLLLSVGLRAALTAGSMLVCAMYCRILWLAAQSFIYDGGVESRIINGSAIFGFGLYSLIFIGKRVYAAIFFGEGLEFDHGRAEALLTCLGLFVGALASLMCVYAWLKFRRKTQLSYVAAGFILICGIAFAVFYGVSHRIV